MSVEIELACRKCGGRAPTRRPYFLKSRWGTLRLQVSLPAGWRVDGNGATCPAHSKAEDPSDDWSAYDLQVAQRTVAEHEAELERCRGCR